MKCTLYSISEPVSLGFVQVSAIEQESIDIDPDTKDLLDALDFKDLSGIAVSATPARV